MGLRCCRYFGRDARAGNISRRRACFGPLATGNQLAPGTQCLERLQHAPALLPLSRRIELFKRQPLLIQRACQTIGQLQLRLHIPSLRCERTASRVLNWLHTGSTRQQRMRRSCQKSGDIQVLEISVKARKRLRRPGGDGRYKLCTGLAGLVCDGGQL